MNITFGTKLTINPNLRKTLKSSNLDEITQKTRMIVENPCLSNLLHEDEVILSGLKNTKGEGLLIEIGNQKIEIMTKNPINSSLVISQILLYICAKNNVYPSNGSPISIFEATKKLLNKY